MIESPSTPPPDTPQEYGLNEADRVGTRVKECPESGAVPPELPDWPHLKEILLQAVDPAVLQSLQSKGRLK